VGRWEVSGRLWRIERNAVTRRGVVIAALLHTDDGRLGWRGLGIERVGFANTQDVLEDVKYFHRYPPRTVVTFRDGRRIVV
jgi:hypothetical protein